MNASNYCPWHCDSDYECEHFLGWTEDGRTIEFRPMAENCGETNQVLPSDIIVKTGVSVRVYRDLPIIDEAPA